MQTLTDARRELLGARHLVVSYGAELLDDQDRPQGVAMPLVGAEVSHNSYAAVHGACQLQLQRRLDWSKRPRVQLYQELADGNAPAPYWTEDDRNVAPNPVPVGTVAGWAGPAVQLAPAPWRPSTTAARCTANGTNTPYLFARPAQQAWSSGQVVQVSAMVQVPAGHEMTFNVHRRDTNRYYGGTTNRLVSTGDPQRLTHTFTLDEAVPFGELDVALVWWGDPAAGVPASGTHAYMGRVLIGDGTTYYDGDTPDTRTYRYSWDGDPHGLGTTSVRERLVEPTPERYDLGVYVLTTPDQEVENSPTTYDVSGLDKLTLLQHQVADTYVVDAGVSYLDAVRQAVTDSGYTGAEPLLDSTAQATVTAEPLVWALDPGAPVTWLRVVNDLLALVGYRGLWCDETGRYRSEPYQAPGDRSPEWTWDAESPLTTTVAAERTLTQDEWDAPNWWRFVRTGLDSQPTEGAGYYTVDHTDGAPRRPRVVAVDAADQAALVTNGDRIVAEDTQRVRSLDVQVGPMPVLGHMDVATYRDPALGTFKVLVRSWSMPLDGGNTELELQVIE